MATWFQLTFRLGTPDMKTEGQMWPEWRLGNISQLHMLPQAS